MPDTLTPADFGRFFDALYGYRPFPWQERLAHRVAAATHGEAGWPAVIAVPTAGGKTACIDIAVFALACQADRRPQERMAPRRIFFVVDRRIIVDDAFERGRTLANRIAAAQSGVLGVVAERLRSLSPLDAQPLWCTELRGGVYRDEHWARSPSQATVVTSTVDQIGSRLLFRGYGLSPHAAPVHAGLIANDSLIILDEAHCARPFLQTLHSVARYRSWAERGLRTPFSVVSMSATPSSSSDEVFGLDELDRRDPVLARRVRCSKPTRLVVAEKAVGKRGSDALADVLVDHAYQLAREGTEPRAVGVIVNRVATAKLVHEKLIARNGNATLLIGRMRPRDRDTVVNSHLHPLRSGGRQSRVLASPTFVVATQCLEVGADLDFDAMVSECASFDALRQRFGRLNRVGALETAPGVIVVRRDQVDTASKPEHVDPVYGDALLHTWQWLAARGADGLVDMGVDAMAALVDRESRDMLGRLLQPSVDSPVMLPAHLDLLVQTSPRPMPDPDPAPFLHGVDRGEPDLMVCWRSDLRLPVTGNADGWREALSLCPPSPAECMRVPISIVRRWLCDQNAGDGADIESSAANTVSAGEATRALKSVMVWRGAESDDTQLVVDPLRDLRPGDVLVIPEALQGWDLLGTIPSEVLPRVDCAEEAYFAIRGVPVLRFQRDVIAGWRLGPNAAAAAELLASCQDLPDDDVVAGALRTLVSETGPIAKIAALLEDDRRCRILLHPYGGVVVQGRRRVNQDGGGDVDEEGETSSSTVQVTLAAHSAHVRAWVVGFAEACGLPPALVDVYQRVAIVHDAGKGDERFQALLHNGSRYLALAAPEPLAKSGRLARSVSQRREQRLRSEYPPGARHELVSVRLAESAASLLDGAADADLALHLVASHHGFCRPFAPVVGDSTPVVVHVALGGHTMTASSTTGLERLDSGVPDRFWALVREYGWWGLAWLEAVFRIADWRASEAEQEHRSAGDAIGLAV